MRAILVVAAALCAVVQAQDLRKVVAQAEALGVRTGVYVRDTENGEPLYAHRSGEAFTPASNMKILTAAAVLWGLGPSHEFVTRFSVRSNRLVVHASGDPNWITGTEHDPARILAGVAAQLRTAGIDAVAGIDLDEGVFQGPGRPPNWPKNQLDLWYCAPTDAFVMEQGTFRVRIAPTGGATADVALVAPPVSRGIQGAIQMTANAKDARYGAIDLVDSVKVNGRFPRRSSEVVIRNAVREPRDWFRAALASALESASIRIDPNAVTPDRELGAVRTPLAPALQRVLRDSSNFDAEQCVRALGARVAGDGSLRGGMAAVRTQLLALVGNLPPEVVLEDGSGLSRDNKVTPALLATVVREALRGPGSGLFLASLPVGGESGTLDDRFTSKALAGRVMAKTGWINGCSSLSGVVKLDDGRLRIFSILMNYDPARGGLNRQLKALQEQMVEAVTRLPAGSHGS